MAARAGPGRDPRRRELAALHPALRGRRRRDRADRVDGQARAARRPAGQAGRRGLIPPPAARSEEHTSELQSLMRISYAVFCLKKKIPAITQVTVNKHVTTPMPQHHIRYK